MEEWIEIVSSYNRDEALAAFEKWKKENQEWYNRLNDDDIVIRVGRVKRKKKNKTLFSYRVRRITGEQDQST